MAKAVDRNGKEIKVGDKVRVYGKSYLGDRDVGILGRVTTVECLCEDGSGVWVNYNASERSSFSDAWPTDRIELVEPANSELEELVRKANEGLEALFNLREQKGSIEVVDKEGGIREQAYAVDLLGILSREAAVGWVNGEFKFRIKPKTFTPFSVGKGWKVELKGDRLHIGCREYDAKAVRQALYCLAHENSNTHTTSDGFKLEATRTGIYSDGEFITWEEAEKILKALEAVDA